MKLIKKHENTIDKMGARERGYADKIGSLPQALEEEGETRVSLEEKLESIEESHNEIISNLIKEHDHVVTKNKVLKK